MLYYFYVFLRVFIFLVIRKMPMFLNSCIRWWKWCSMFSILYACRRIRLCCRLPIFRKYLNTENVYKHQISSRFTMPMSFHFSYTIYRQTFLWKINRFFFFISCSMHLVLGLCVFFSRSAFFFIFIFVCLLPLNFPPAKKCNSRKGVRLWMLWA